jgi:bifunctional DNA-binding transcriptional regulator/antitoxin component of YhaV-PrlF toxin-antitoxin module
MHNDNHYLLKKVLIENDKHLDMTEQAIFYNLKDAEEEMQQWTEQNREHLLCYIIREIPWKKAFRDEPAYTFWGRPDEPYLEENDYKEYVYLPSGFRQKFHFKVGDMVEYIYHDVDVTAMKWGCIAKLPSKKDNSILILDSKRSVEGLSQKAYIDCCVKVPARYVFQL